MQGLQHFPLCRFTHGCRRGLNGIGFAGFRMTWLCLLILSGMMPRGGVCAMTQTLDSVVASVGNVAITASDLEKEFRFERFLDDQWPPPPADAPALNAARQALTYQLLLSQEENPGPAEKEESEKAAAGRLDTLRKEFARPEDFQAAMKDLGMTEAQVLARITQQELMLRLIDQRLRPEALPSEDDVANYYRLTFLPKFQKENGGRAAPPLSEVVDQIREVLIQKRINELLDQWIEELRPTSPVRLHNF